MLAAVLVAAAMVLGAARPADAAITKPVERKFVQLVNGTRSTALLPSLKVNDRLSEVARRHSKRMAAAGELYHSDLQRLLGANVSSVGENVGMGTSLDQLLGAFMASPPHAQNILGGYSRTGVGVYKAGGTIWITQIFAS